MRTQSMTPAERAAAGAQELDLVWPGWWRHVKLRDLDLASSCNCVLGQLSGSGSYSEGLEKFQDRQRSARQRVWAPLRFGFVAHARNYLAVTKQYQALTNAWRHEIRARKNKTVRI